MLDDEFPTVAEVAGLLKLNQQTLRNGSTRSNLPAVRVGRRVRVRRTVLDKLREKSPAGPSRRMDESAAQAFWDGEVPEPLVGPGELG